MQGFLWVYILHASNRKHRKVPKSQAVKRGSTLVVVFPDLDYVVAAAANYNTLDLAAEPYFFLIMYLYF